jgi:hypothetical protein
MGEAPGGRAIDWINTPDQGFHVLSSPSGMTVSTRDPGAAIPMIGPTPKDPRRPSAAGFLVGSRQPSDISPRFGTDLHGT